MSEPKNLVREKLFSKDGELYLDNKPYIGPYNIKADGTYYTLSRFVDKKSKRLKTTKSSIYQDLLKKSGGIDVSEKNSAIVGQTILPIQDDYDKGFYTRYFIFRKEEKNFTEVSEKSFGDVGTKISDVIYGKLKLDWKISGPINDVFDLDGVRKEAGVRDTNERMLKRLELKHPGIKDRLKNLIQFRRNT
jgi:hypothetical protein